MSVLEVETDINISIAASPTEQAEILILVIMYVCNIMMDIYDITLTDNVQ
jgi:hypothetical protein